MPPVAEGSACLVGVDLTPIPDVAAALEHFGDRYAARLFTEHEVASSGAAAGSARAASLAARFAAKEAALKVLAPSGSRPPWRDIEVRRSPKGSCRIQLHGRAAALASSRGVGPMSVSLSHEGAVAVAVVVAMRVGHLADEAADEQESDRSRGNENRSIAMTMTDEGTRRIRELLAEHGRLPVDVATLTDDDDLFQAGMTSHASVNVMLAIEDAFDIEFPEAMLRKSTFASVHALRQALAQLAVAEVGG